MPRTVLVVEDEVLVRYDTCDFLRAAGYHVLEASTAQQAIDILQENPAIDLVFTDVQMPGTMDGIKLSHYIRNRWPPVKLIVVSGMAILEASSLPDGSRFFPKPYTNHAIADAMARMLSSDSKIPNA